MFQKKIVEKYLAQINPDIIKAAYSRFQQIFDNKTKQENIRNTKEEQYQEGFLRDLFVSVLGYTIKPEQDYTIFTEAKNDVKNKSNSKKADAAICEENNENNIKAVIELKGINTVDLDQVAFQAFSYKNFHSGCNYVIVSNFQRLRFYVDTQSDFLEFNLFDLSYENFSLLYLILEINQIKKDIPLKLKNETLSEEKQITNEFYKAYSSFKRSLFEDLIEKNPNLDKLLLFKKTQKLLDRILFILFCEDRGLLPANSVAHIIERYNKAKELDIDQPLYSFFKQFFSWIDAGNAKNEIFAYNGGLFKNNDVLDSITVGDDVLLYTQKLSDYDFESQISVDILGRIFENSLTEIEEVQKSIDDEKHGIQTVQSNIGKRKKDGVFYTPEYITKYIVENTIGSLCKNKKEELLLNDTDFNYEKKYTKKQIEELDSKLSAYRSWLLSLKILDPACGSGAFLNSALHQLKKEHLFIDQLWKIIHPNELNFSQIENIILENNLYGVDINEDSIEITKLSLWLHTAQKNRKLTSLNDKIKSGNSLISDPAVAGDKAFDWQKEFPEVFQQGGFDVVIGNPPYVSAPTQIMNTELAKNRQAIIDSEKYETLFQKWDLYIPFIELGVKHLLKDGGLCSMIIPFPFTNQLYAEKSRRMILDTYNLKEIVDCTDTKVFADAAVKSCIFVVQRTKSENCIAISTIDGTQIKTILKKTREELLQDEKSFVWNTKDIKRDTNRHSGMNVLGDFCYISKGMVLNSDEHAEEKFVKADLISETQDDIHCKKYIEAKDLERYQIKRIRFLEYGTERCPAKISRPTFPELYNNKKLLTNKIGMLQCIIDGENILCDQTNRICILWKDLKNIENNSIINSIKKYSSMQRENMENLSESIDLRYLLALLNSKYSNILLDAIRGDGNIDINPEYIRKIPVPAISPEEQKPFIEKADKMLSLNAELQKNVQRFIGRIKERFGVVKISAALESFYELDFKGFVKELAKFKIKLSLKDEDEWEEYFNSYKDDISKLKEQIASTDKEIDSAVYQLYGLSEEEISIVESK